MRLDGTDKQKVEPTRILHTLTRSSRNGWGVNNARTFVAIAPSIPHTTIRSPSRMTPFDRMTSIVVPIPSMTLTSRTVHSSSEIYIKRSVIRCWVSWMSSMIMSGTPSPVMAEVGTRETVRPRSLFSSYSSELKPCSAKASFAAWRRVSNSRLVPALCCARLSRNDPLGISFQP